MEVKARIKWVRQRFAVAVCGPMFTGKWHSYLLVKTLILVKIFDCLLETPILTGE